MTGLKTKMRDSVDAVEMPDLKLLLVPKKRARMIAKLRRDLEQINHEFMKESAGAGVQFANEVQKEFHLQNPPKPKSKTRTKGARGGGKS